jgi:hypothetical protein
VDSDFEYLVLPLLGARALIELVASLCFLGLGQVHPILA